MRRLLALAALFLVLMPAAARAASCSVTATTLAFGTVAFSTVASTSTVKVTCTGSESYTVALSTGNGSYSQRQMKSGSNVLDYNIYTNSGYTSVWGNGSGGTSENSGSFGGSGGNTSFTAYGQVPAQAGPAAGSYSDSITVTVTY